MFHPAIDNADKNARRLVNFSLLYLLATWVVAITSFFDVPRGKFGEAVNSTEITWVTMVQTAAFPIGIALLVFGTIWVKGLIVTSRFIQPEGFGYRQGWSFWGWVTPIAQLWIPKRLIDYTTAIFDEFVGVTAERKTRNWWTLWILVFGCNFLGSLSGFISEDLTNLFGVLGAAVMTLAFPLWRTVVENTTASQQEAIKKLEGLA